MLSRSVGSSRVIIVTAVIAAVGLFLMVVSLGEHPHEKRFLLETMLFLPLLLLCSANAFHARRS